MGVGPTIYPQRPGQMECDVCLHLLSNFIPTDATFMDEVSLECLMFSSGFSLLNLSVVHFK